MIRALLLIFDPAATWEKIEAEKPSVARLFFMFVLPVVLISIAVEGWLLLEFGMERGAYGRNVSRVPQEVLIRYGVSRFVLDLLLCFVGALLVKKLGESFHRRHSYAECFATMGYSLGPYFFCRMLDGWPALNTWIPWGIGALLCVSVLYRGIPRIMKPDPSNALGLYLMCSLLIIVLTGLSHFLASLVLNERIFRQGFTFAA